MVKELLVLEDGSRLLKKRKIEYSGIFQLFYFEIQILILKGSGSLNIKCTYLPNLFSQQFLVPFVVTL